MEKIERGEETRNSGGTIGTREAGGARRIKKNISGRRRSSSRSRRSKENRRQT